ESVGRPTLSATYSMGRLMTPWRWSVPLCLGIVRRFSRTRSRRSCGSRALRNASSAARYSGVRLAGIGHAPTGRSMVTTCACSTVPPNTICTPSVRSLALELYVLVRRRIGVDTDQPQAGLGDTGPVAVDERRLHDRDEHRLRVGELVDSLQCRL